MSSYREIRGYDAYLEHVFSRVEEIQGDFVELGFGVGRSASLITEMMSSGKIRKRKTYLFDSFSGFPKPTSKDTRTSHRKQAKVGDWNRPESIKIAKKIKKNAPFEVVIEKGFFKDVLPHAYDGDTIALLHLDCDLYESYKVGLECLYDKVASGGIIVFDEYTDELDLKKWPGAQIAIDNFFEEKNDEFYNVKVIGRDIRWEEGRSFMKSYAIKK